MTPTIITAISVSPEADSLADSLLQQQYFPNVKSPGEELPPIFDSSSFSRQIAAQLKQFQLSEQGGHYSDYVTFRTRRFDGLVRRMRLPHPVAYARLVLHMQQNWPRLAPLLGSPESMIKPSISRHDSRVIVMDYGSPTTKSLVLTRSAQSKQYLLKADIGNCFPSIYTHSLDWALRGFSVAKSNQRGNTWEEKLDHLTQGCHNNETKGLMIGPAVSNILTELVLQRIDTNLRDKGFSFTRYVDDYTAFFRTRDQAESFISVLDAGLSQYRLVLNSRKTIIKSLHDGFGEPWINDIQSHLPKGRGSALASVRFLQHCESLAHRHHDQSVLRYGVKTLLNKRRCPGLGMTTRRKPVRSAVAVLEELVRINYFHPHLSCLVARQVLFTKPLLLPGDRDHLAVALREQMQEAIRRSETDTVLWLLYTIRKLLKRQIPLKELRRVADLDDDLLWVAIADASNRGKKYVIAKVKGLDKDDRGTREQHWLSRYELFRTRQITTNDLNSSYERPWFVAARSAGLRFSSLA